MQGTEEPVSAPMKTDATTPTAVRPPLSRPTKA